MKLVALAGGTGAAKLLRGFLSVIDPEELTIIGNTGDDCVVWGLSVSPDLDTVTYTLAGIIDEAKGWGVKEETFRCREAIAPFGEETYFALGDRDLAVHIHRTHRLKQGASLSEVTEEIRRKLGVPSRILPMSDQRVATRPPCSRSRTRGAKRPSPRPACARPSPRPMRSSCVRPTR
jgi:LPPG:FO 2-phospho-L-lactate transferase